MVDKPIQILTKEQRRARRFLQRPPHVEYYDENGNPIFIDDRLLVDEEKEHAEPKKKRKTGELLPESKTAKPKATRTKTKKTKKKLTEVKEE